MRAPLLGIFGFIVALLGFALVMANKDGTMLLPGLLFLAFGTGLNYWLIARGTAH